MRNLIFALSAVFGLAAHAQDPVKHVAAFVDPYYRAAIDSAGRPSVAVAVAFDERLSFNDPISIKEVEAEIRAKPELITPMTLMVLSIRLYDTGFRDEAVFWHYVAKDRMRTISQIVSGGISGAILATRDFAATAGPAINGYAFCDLEKQRNARRAAFEWVRDNPYQPIFLAQLPSRFSDRSAALREVLTQIESDVQKEVAFLSDAKTIELLRSARKANGAQSRYCW